MQPRGIHNGTAQNREGEGTPSKNTSRSASARMPSLPQPSSAASPRFDQPLPALPSMPPPSAAQQPAALVTAIPQAGAGAGAAAHTVTASVPAAGVQEEQGSSLGVRQAMRATGATGATKLPALQTLKDDTPLAREPTLTARARSVQAPDVARQAISELGVLARELATLPEQLEQRGLTRVYGGA